MKIRNILAAALLAGTLTFTLSQANAQAAPAVAPAEAYDRLLTVFEKQILDIAEAMPADKYNWAPSQSDFKDSWKTDFTTPDKARSFAEQLKHVAGANYYFFTQPGQKEPDFGKAIKPLTKKEDIIAALRKSFAWSHEQVRAITAQNAFDPQEINDQKLNRAAVVSWGLAHLNDHMGQMSVYLRMNGIVPPQSRK